MMAGAFRYICANGMVVPEGICQTVRVPHAGQVIDRVRSGAFEVLDGLTRVIESRDAMRSVELSLRESVAFAKAALQLRFDAKPAGEGEAIAPPPVTEADVLQARRHADDASDLWTTLNRTQETRAGSGQGAA